MNSACFAVYGVLSQPVVNQTTSVQSDCMMSIIIIIIIIIIVVVVVIVFFIKS